MKENADDFEFVHKIIETGAVEKLKLEQCKVYLRKNGLRLTGNKSTHIQRIKEHLHEGEKKYPVSSFVLNCKGDACTGDVVTFEQNIEVLWSKGEKPLPPLHPLLIEGRNLYCMETLRQGHDGRSEKEPV
ncbi:hypothetical protein Dsin_013476 [Dipteronia sinensis]|uniref:SAP domain-containing protein n=1 Tax=Dipteronia sinensis TaxID=43782 RepID=A0AAE0AK08_9ROSI|nr:hypothetical protein Dsin_013476 [Dipteronia sinensis]